MSEPLVGTIQTPGEGGAGSGSWERPRSAGVGEGNPYGEARAGGRTFKAGAFGPAWEVFTDFDSEIRGLGQQAGQAVSNVIRANEDLPLDELKALLKKVLPDHMVPYVDLADETGRAFYSAYRSSALAGSTTPTTGGPGTMNIIDQDGVLVDSRVPVGLANPEDIFDYDTSGVGKSVVPARSWQSATGKAFQGAGEIAAREGKWMALDRVMNRLIGYSDRRVQNTYRDVVERAAIGDPYSVGWQRLAYGGACAFCRMMAGRGAVYKSNASASFVVGRGKVRKVRGRPRQRGRKARSWERPDSRQIRELNETYHDNCQCKVIPRFTFNGAEMPLPPLLQFMQDKYQAEYYSAKKSLTNPTSRRRKKFKKEDIPRSWADYTKGLKETAKRELNIAVWGVGRAPHIYDVIGLTKWSKKARAVPKAKKGAKSPNIRDILRVTRKNNMSARQRRFMPTKPHDYMVDQLASAWPGSPYLRPQPMRFKDFARDYAGQAWRGAKVEGGILARRKGNQFVGRVVNKQATRTQRKINRRIDQIEGLPTWGNTGLKIANSEVRRKSTRAIRYNAKQGLKFATGQQPSWDTSGLFRREVDETIRYQVGSARRIANREVNQLSGAAFREIKGAVNQITAPAYTVLDRGGKRFWGLGSLFTDPVKRSIKSKERRVIRRVNRPLKRRATRFKRSYAKGGSLSRTVSARMGRDI